MSQKYKVILSVIGLSLISSFWILWSSFNPVNEKALVKFISVREILDSKNIERVRLGGIVADSSIIVSPSNRMEVYFNIKEGASILPVKFIGARPDLFKHGAEVIVEGAYSNGSFNADMLQTKCASRYEGDLRDASSYQLDDINI
jgi:cytochrome c-type biogenesis protein CcmE